MRIRVLLTFVLLGLPTIATAQWINNGTAISLANGAQYYPTAAPDGAGGAIITWQDQRAGNYDIYAQRIDATGVAKWTSDGVAICTAANPQLNPAIVSDGAGGAIITWQDQRSGLYDIYVQRINSSGTVQWTANGVLLSGASFDQVNPVIISDGAAGAIAAWEDNRPFGGNWDVYARRVNSAGVPQGVVDGNPVCTAINDQLNVVITSDNASGAIVAWTDNRGAAADIYAQRITSAGGNSWTANGIPVCTATNTQTLPVITADGSGGAVIAWQDNRSPSSDIYVQRVNGAGVVQWTVDGLPVCTDANAQYAPQVVWDNTTGAIVSWYDYRSGSGDIYARRVTPAGSAVWTYDGTPVCTATGSQTEPRMVSDGAGGAIMAWLDNRGAYGDIYAQRIDATGLTKWSTTGMPVTLADFSQYSPLALVGDGNSGAIVTWYDGRSGPANDIYAQHIDGRYGYWGRPDPVLFAAKDVPADQGGKVRLEWYGSQRDQLNDRTISHYTIWRAIDQAAYNAAAAAGVPQLKPGDPMHKVSGGAIRHEQAAAADYFWQLIGEEDAIYRYAYSFDAATSFDSTATSTATNKFQIVAHALDDQYTNWPSNVIAGRSVDNISPPAPLFLTALRNGANVNLKWNGVHVKDLDKYTVYRASSTGVTAIPANFLSTDNDTLLTDTSAPASALYYIVTATDIHQNQGLKSNEASVAGATGIGGNLPPVTALTVLQNSPNPFTSETQLHVGLPSKKDVRVEIYDVAGRRVRSVLVPAQAKGWNTLRITARDDRGTALSSGVYFYKVHAGAETVTKKMVIAR
jgi:hypothetical protein